jgi:hypothetical protein
MRIIYQLKTLCRFIWFESFINSFSRDLKHMKSILKSSHSPIKLFNSERGIVDHVIYHQILTSTYVWVSTTTLFKISHIRITEGEREREVVTALLVRGPPHIHTHTKKKKKKIIARTLHSTYSTYLLASEQGAWLFVIINSPRCIMFVAS